jgi:uncharacterized Zn-binding protein involved in type VI secretion
MVMLWEAAGVGHRITHEDDLPEPKELSIILVGQKFGIDGGASFGAMLAGQLAKLQSQHFELKGGDPGSCPDPTGAIEAGSVDTFIGVDKRAAATANEDIVVDCDNDSDGPIIQGATSVFVNGLPFARRNDQLDCGARIGEGEPSILIGGEPSAVAGKSTSELIIGGKAFGPLLANALAGGQAPSGASSALLGKLIGGADKAAAALPTKLTSADVGAYLSQGKVSMLAAKLSLCP